MRMESSAWELFCRLFSQPLIDFARHRLELDADQAEDAVQMAFVRCVKSIHTFNPSRGRLLPWLKAIVRNEAHTLRKKSPGYPKVVHFSALADGVIEKAISNIDTAPLPDEILGRKDIQIAVQETLLHLNSRYSEALKLKYLDGLKVVDIASRLGISEKAAESLLTRSREAFRKAFVLKMKAIENAPEEGTG